MKFFVALCLFFYYSAFLSGVVLAHVAGQPPFFKINGVYSDLYPVPSSSVADFVLPQDLAHTPFPVGEQLNFQIDFAVLGISPEVLKKTTFLWDFGDGKSAIGTSMNHVYTKPGSYTLTVKIDSSELPTPQLFQSVLIHILPSDDYVLPKSAIKINGQLPDSVSGMVYVDLNSPVQFESVGSVGESYFWDFGDTTPAVYGQRVSHEYPSKQFPGGLSIVSVLLRVTDKQGFISDAYVMMMDKSLVPIVTPALTNDQKQLSTGGLAKGKKLLVLITVGIVSIFGIFIFRKKI